MPQNPITPEQAKKAIETLKAKKKVMNKCPLLPGHTKGNPKYNWSKVINMSMIANEVGCSRGVLYSKMNENKEDITEAEIKQARRFQRILKPFMRIKNKEKTSSQEPKRNTLEYYKNLASKRSSELEKEKRKEDRMYDFIVEINELEQTINQQSEIIKQHRESMRKVNDEYMAIIAENNKFKRENGELRHQIMIQSMNLPD